LRIAFFALAAMFVAQRMAAGIQRTDMDRTMGFYYVAVRAETFVPKMIRTRDPAESRIVQELRDRKRLRQSANYQELTDRLVILSLYWPKLLEKVLQRELQVEIKKRAKRHNLKVAMKLKVKMAWAKLAGPRPSLVH
jgi:hypothetical protein